MAKMLYLIRGLPGSGKSTFAEDLADALGAHHFEADSYHMQDGIYKWRAENVQKAHEWCQNNVMTYMQAGLTVVVSNTLTTAKELEPYLAMAHEFGYRVTSLVVENRHGGVNVHDVPQETLDKMRNRFTIKL